MLKLNNDDLLSRVIWIEQGIENEIRLWSDFIFGRGSLLWAQTSSTVSDDLLRTRSIILPLSWVGDEINCRRSLS